MSVGDSIVKAYKPKKMKAYKAPNYTKPKIKPVKVKSHKLKP